RKLFLKGFEDFSLENVVTFAWKLGIIVLPLKDSGAFSGACWKVKDRTAIVLKQSTDRESRWVHDLLHELYHISQNQKYSDFAVIDQSDEIDDSDEELEANEFGADVVLNGRAEELVEECVREAKGSVERLK